MRRSASPHLTSYSSTRAGRELPLAKLKGRRVVLVFWRSESAPSMQAIAAALQAKNGAQPPLVLAINDGEPAQHAHHVLSQAKIVGHLGR